MDKKKICFGKDLDFFFSYQVDIPHTEASFWDNLQDCSFSEPVLMQGRAMVMMHWIFLQMPERRPQCLEGIFCFSVVSAIWDWVPPLQENSKPHLVDVQGSYHNSSVPQLAKISISGFAAPWRNANAYPLYLWDFFLSTPHCLGSQDFIKMKIRVV